MPFLFYGILPAPFLLLACAIKNYYFLKPKGLSEG